MHEVFHILGLCGDKHISLIAFLNEWPSLNYIFTYIKFKSNGL
jgi:hypothetical protein